MITLAVYLAATAATALSFAPWWFFLFRFMTGLGIGGEYAAINSAIDELIPSSFRGRVDLIINGTFWVGAAAGALLSIVALNKNFLPVDVGWRVSLRPRRRARPGHPRRAPQRAGEPALAVHPRPRRGGRPGSSTGSRTRSRRRPASDWLRCDDTIEIHQRRSIGFLTIAKTVLTSYPKRTVLGLGLFIGQAFLYNAVTFGYASILTTFFHVSAGSTGYYYVDHRGRQLPRPARCSAGSSTPSAASR